MDDDDKNDLCKAWTMGMLTNNGDISMSMMNEHESMSEDDKQFLYARSVHSNHLIQYHMHQIIKRQKVVNEYKSMTMEGMDLTPLESNLHKYDLVIISQIIQMIETDIFWHHKTFESVLSNLRNMWVEGIHELENRSMYCTNNAENDDEMDEVEVIYLCSVSQNKNKACGKGKESAKQESQDKTESDATNRMEDEIRTKKSRSTTKNGEVETTMMCWEAMNDSPRKEPHEESENEGEKPVETTQKQKDQEEHVEPTLNKDNQLQISIEEFIWEREDDGKTFDMVEKEQQQFVYIMNLKNGLQKDCMKLYDDEGPNDKKPAVENRLIEETTLNNPNHVYKLYEESGSDNDNIEDSVKGEIKKNLKEKDYT